VRDEKLRLRFAPSPTGHLHIGNARTALFNWLLARQSGGTLVLRIDDTDRTRHQADAVGKIIEDLRWLGIDWDEGPDIGGPHAPYFQSQRLDLYEQYFRRLLDEGRAYYCFETPEQLEAMRREAARQKRPFRYPRPDPLPTEQDARKARAEGRPVTVRFKMPDHDITVHDRIMGDVTIRAEELDDFVIRKADGFPTFHLASVVDDAVMGITDILRGQEWLAQTPRHIALQQALGLPTPRYAHLPLIFNMDGSKMSKRDKDKAIARGQRPPEIDVFDFRAAGYLPEVLVNFIALLGWSPGHDREKLTRQELIELFSIERIGKTASKFDREKLLAFNTEANAAADEDRLLAGLKDYLSVNETPLRQADDETLRRLLRANAGFRTFRDIDEKSRFLFLPDEQIEYDPKAIAKVLAKGGGAGFAMLREVLGELEALQDWSAPQLESVLKRLQRRHGVGLGQVAQPVRVAVSGTTVSPPIFETLELLGKPATLRRIRTTLEKFAPQVPDR